MSQTVEACRAQAPGLHGWLANAMKLRCWASCMFQADNHAVHLIIQPMPALCETLEHASALAGPSIIAAP